MATYTMLRRATAVVVPLAARRAAVPSSSRAFHSDISVKLLLHKETTPFVPSRSFSNAVAKKTVEDDNLVQLLQTEIDRALKDHTQQVKIPKEFPFEIEYELEGESLYLKRQYEDETIRVRIRVDDVGRMNLESSYWHLFVTVVKGNGSFLQFDATTYPDKVEIFKLFPVKKLGESEDHLDSIYCSHLDENLQTAFLNYLEIRGITPDIYNFTHEYLLNKYNKDDIVWLQNLKCFVEK